MLFNFLIFKIMKFSKYLMVAAAGLMMTACSQKDENPNGIDGVVALTVNVAGPASRAITDGTADGTQIALTYGEAGNVEVKLTATAGGDADWVKVPEGGKITYYDVENPTKVEVRINEGAESYANLDALKDLTPATMKAYGSSTTFTFDGTTTNDGKTYDKYIATVTAQIPVGRIEVSGIQHVSHKDGAECIYNDLNIEGLYFDNAATTPNTPADVTFDDATDVNKDEITGTFNGEPATVFPEGGKVSAFNFFPSVKMPALKLVFKGTTKDGKLNNERRYAVVKKYYEGEGVGRKEITAFEAGKVYRIKKVEIADDDFTGDESGNTTVAVEVTVEVQDWTIVDTTVEF